MRISGSGEGRAGLAKTGKVRDGTEQGRKDGHRGEKNTGEQSWEKNYIPLLWAWEGEMPISRWENYSGN